MKNCFPWNVAGRGQHHPLVEEVEEEAGDVEEGFGFLNDRDGQDEFLRQFQEVQITLQKIKWLNILYINVHISSIFKI